jgi:hypothetical protein
MSTQEIWTLRSHAVLSRRLAGKCTDAKSAQALLALAAEYEARVRRLALAAPHD